MGKWAGSVAQQKSPCLGSPSEELRWGSSVECFLRSRCYLWDCHPKGHKSLNLPQLSPMPSPQHLKAHSEPGRRESSHLLTSTPEHDITTSLPIKTTIIGGGKWEEVEMFNKNKIKLLLFCSVWWCLPVTPVFEMQRQEDPSKTIS